MFARSLARLARPAATVLLWGACALGQAAELAEPQLRSYLGQPLVADIELSNLVDASRTVLVKLAHPEVYNGAGIVMHPVLSSVRMSVMRRDGRQFLHITSIKPVESEYVHVFLELNDGGKTFVRGATLWLSADPNPAPPAPPPAPPAEPVSAAASMGEGEEIVAPDAPAAAAPAPAAVPRARSRTRVAACAAPSESEKAKLCAAMDYKNGMLTAQIVELEDKVRLLQTAIEGKAPPPKVAAASASASVSAQQAPPRINAGSAAKPKKPAPDAFPWLWVGVGVAVTLALAGGGWFVWRRKSKGKAGAEAAGPGLLARLKAKFTKKADAGEPKEEPTGA